MYYKYYGVIVTYHALAQVNQVGTVKTSIFSLLDPYYLLMFADIIFFAVIFLRKKSAQRWKTRAAAVIERKLLAAVFACCLIMSIAFYPADRPSSMGLSKPSRWAS